MVSLRKSGCPLRRAKTSRNIGMVRKSVCAADVISRRSGPLRSGTRKSTYTTRAGSSCGTRAHPGPGAPSRCSPQGPRSSSRYERRPRYRSTGRIRGKASTGWRRRVEPILLWVRGPSASGQSWTGHRKAYLKSESGWPARASRTVQCNRAESGRRRPTRSPRSRTCGSRRGQPK